MSLTFSQPLVYTRKAKQFMIYFCCVVLITGGSGTNTAEIYNPVKKSSCSLPQFSEVRSHHSDDSGLVCGEYKDVVGKTCVKWSPASGNWTQSHTLRQRRGGHVSWATASGVYLIGGYFSTRTSEKLKLDGSDEESFSLKYSTRLLEC